MQGIIRLFSPSHKFIFWIYPTSGEQLVVSPRLRPTNTSSHWKSIPHQLNPQKSPHWAPNQWLPLSYLSISLLQAHESAVLTITKIVTTHCTHAFRFASSEHASPRTPFLNYCFQYTPDTSLSFTYSILAKHSSSPNSPWICFNDIFLSALCPNCPKINTNTLCDFDHCVIYSYTIPLQCLSFIYLDCLFFYHLIKVKHIQHCLFFQWHIISDGAITFHLCCAPTPTSSLSACSSWTISFIVRFIYALTWWNMSLMP